MPSIEEQLVDSSRTISDLVVSYVGQDQDLFDEAMTLVMRDEYPISMRAARVVYFAFDKHSHLIKPHLQAILDLLPTAKVDGVKRSLLKILADKPSLLDEDMLGQCADMAFTFCESPKEAIAIRAISLDILVQVSKTYPEIKPEVIAIAESIIPQASPGMLGKCRKIVKSLSRE